MNYLDYDKSPAFLERHFSDDSRVRMVGPDRDHDSGYYDLVRFFGNEAVAPDSIKLTHVSDEYHIPDERIAAFAKEMAERMRVEGRLHDGPPAMKLQSVYRSSTDYELIVQPSSYDQFAGSCMALDVEHALFDNQGGTLREYYRSRCPSNAVEDNPLAICFGVCGLLETRDAGRKEYLIVRRAMHLSSLGGTYGPSAAGGVDYRTDAENLRELLVLQMTDEVNEEIGLEADEYEIVPLAFAREIFRGEKPQLFCLMRSDVTSSEVAGRLEGLPRDKREFDDYQFATSAAIGESRDSLFSALNFEAQMSWLLTEEYLASE
jgi:hypothetical protein